MERRARGPQRDRPTEEKRGAGAVQIPGPKPPLHRLPLGRKHSRAESKLHRTPRWGRGPVPRKTRHPGPWAPESILPKGVLESGASSQIIAQRPPLPGSPFVQSGHPIPLPLGGSPLSGSAARALEALGTAASLHRWGSVRDGGRWGVRVATRLSTSVHFFYLFFLMATPEACGGSQARSQTRATAAGLHHSHRTPDLSHVCNLHHSSQQRQVPLTH